MSIYSDRSNPSNILESYTFSFHYAESGSRELSGMAGPGPDGAPITIGVAASGLRKITKHLIDFNILLPELPRMYVAKKGHAVTCSSDVSDKRYLMCHLFFPNGNIPREQPPGFHACTDNTIFVPANSEWILDKQNVGSMNAGSFV